LLQNPSKTALKPLFSVQRLHRGEQQNIPDRLTVRQQHGHAVDAEADNLCKLTNSAAWMADFPALMARQFLRATGLFSDFDVSFDVSDVSLSPIRDVDLRIKELKFLLFEVPGRVRIDVQCCTYISMAENILDDLDVDAFLAHPRCEGMTKRMTTERRKKNKALHAGIQHMIVAVPDDAADGFVQGSLMLRMTEAVDKNEIRESIH